MISIFAYTNYRDYLTAWYQERKKTPPRFSYQAFAKLVGLKNKSNVFNIIAGYTSLCPLQCHPVLPGAQAQPQRVRIF